jgi:hypothetical protein
LKKSLGVALVIALALGLSALFGAWLAGQVAEPEPALVESTGPVPAAPDWQVDRRPVAEPLQARVAQPGGAVDSRWVDRNRAAIVALEAGELERAAELFEDCAAALPDEPVFARNAAEALARLAVREHGLREPCPECITWLERALELAPGRDDLARLLERWRREAELHKDFWRESSLHFDLAYDGSRDELLWGSGRILNELENIYIDLGEAFGMHPVDVGGTKIRVVLYRRAGFSALTGLGEWAGGAFDGTVRVPVGDRESESGSFDRVLRHEVVHYFVRAAGGPEVPGWLNEGLAQMLESSDPEPRAAARRALEGRELYPLETLQGSLAGWSDAAEITLAYQQSLVLCETIERQYGAQVLFEMVAACSREGGPEQRFQELTRVPLVSVLEDLQSGL